MSRARTRTAMAAWHRSVHGLAACTRGRRRQRPVACWERDGDCRQTTNGVGWRRATEACEVMPRMAATPHTPPFWREGLQVSTRYWVVIASRVATTRE